MTIDNTDFQAVRTPVGITPQQPGVSAQDARAGSSGRNSPVPALPGDTPLRTGDFSAAPPPDATRLSASLQGWLGDILDESLGRDALWPLADKIAHERGITGALAHRLSTEQPPVGLMVRWMQTGWPPDAPGRALDGTPQHELPVLLHVLNTIKRRPNPEVPPVLRRHLHAALLENLTAPDAPAQPWRQRQDELEQQMCNALGWPGRFQTAFLGWIVRDSLLTDFHEHAPPNLQALRRAPRFWELAVLHAVHRPEPLRTANLLVECLDLQLQADGGGPNPVLPAADVRTLLGQVLPCYLEGNCKRIRCGDGSSAQADPGLKELDRAVAHATTFLEARLAQLSPQDQHLADSLRADGQARIDAFVTDRLQRWQASRPVAAGPLSLTDGQRLQLANIQPWLPPQVP